MPEPSTKSVPEVATELWSLTKDYARQETVEPLKEGFNSALRKAA